jgi:undecaprenyl-diphosphatase
MEQLWEVLKAALLGIVQGITEWLPVSSTGHLILVNQFTNLKETSAHFIDTFLVVIQLGSILAVLVLYFHKLNPFSRRKTVKERKDTYSLWFKVLVAAVPAAIVGLLLEEQIADWFNNWQTVAVTLIVYGVLFIILESRKKKPTIKNFSQLGGKTALLIGACQVLALIPGTSRSGATILGAVFLGCSRYVAAEFSFFLAVPVMFGASGLKLLKHGLNFTGAEWLVLLVGMAVAFLVSVFAIKFLMGFIKKHDFKAFGYYRIVLGIAVILYFVISGSQAVVW